ASKSPCRRASSAASMAVSKGVGRCEQAISLTSRHIPKRGVGSLSTEVLLAVACLASSQGANEEFVGDHLHGLSQIQRRLVCRNGHPNDRVATGQFLGGEPAFLVSKEDDDALLGSRESHGFFRQRCGGKYPGDSTACGRADHDISPDDGLVDVVEDFRAFEDVTGF